MITVSHLKKEYGNAVPLTDVNAEIKKGEVISIIGPSGTGKSTFLRALNMLDPPTSGQIFIDGEEITAKGCKLNLVRRKMGMVFQSFNLFNHMNVLENITYGPMKLLGLSKEEAEKRADAALARLGIEKLKHCYNHRLSGGEKKMAAIATVLCMEPDTLLMDEPTAALDSLNRRQVINTINSLPNTKLITSHDLDMIYDSCERVLLLSGGEIAADGGRDEILRNRALLEANHMELPLRFS